MGKVLPLCCLTFLSSSEFGLAWDEKKSGMAFVTVVMYTCGLSQSNFECVSLDQEPLVHQICTTFEAICWVVLDDWSSALGELGTGHWNCQSGVLDYIIHWPTSISCCNLQCSTALAPTSCLGRTESWVPISDHCLFKSSELHWQERKSMKAQNGSTVLPSEIKLCLDKLNSRSI